MWRFDNGGLHSCSKSNIPTEKNNSIPKAAVQEGGGLIFMENGIWGLAGIALRWSLSLS